MDADAYAAAGFPAPPRPWFAWVGALLIAAAIGAVAADIIAISQREGASFLATSVSATAVGATAWFVDAAIYLTAAAIAALAFALHHWHLDHGRYRFGIFCLGGLSISMFLLAGWSAYDPDQVPDFGFHMMQVYALSAFFPLAALTLARALTKVHARWGVFSVCLAALWMISGPIYAVTPEDWEGLFQRIAFVMMLIWLAGLGVVLIGAAVRARRVDPTAEGA